jgi:hypothetical protein
MDWGQGMGLACPPFPSSPRSAETVHERASVRCLACGARGRGEEFLYCVKAAGFAVGGRLPGGHAASGRSHPQPPTKKPVEQPTHEAMDPLIKKSQPTGHNFRNLD